MRHFVTLLLVLVAAVACAPPAAQVRDISQDEFLANPSATALVLDVRTRGEYADGRVPEAVNIPHDELAERLSELGVEKDAPVVVYCRSGVRAAKASDVLIQAGYSNLRHLEGDMQGWLAAGRPVETD